MLGWIKNLGLSWKVQFGPGVLVVALIGVGTYALHTLKANEQSTADLISGPMRRSELANDLSTALWTAHTRLYRLAATAAAEKDDEKVEKFAKDAATASNKVLESLNALEAGGNINPELFAKLKTAVSGYVKQSKAAVEMTDDSGSGIQFIKGAERQFGQVQSLTDNLIATAVENRDLEIARSQTRLEHEQLTLTVLLIVGAILGVLFAFIVGRSISRPVVAMATAMRRLGAGDFSVELPGLNRHDEIGQMARAIEDFKVQAIAKAEEDMADRESKNRELADVRRGELHSLAKTFEDAVGTIIEHVNSASSDLETSAIVLTKSSVATQELSAVVASTSEETSSNVQSVASATEEMAASVTEIGRQVHDSNDIAAEAVSQAQRTDVRMNELSTAAERIGDVTMLITSIASQTNLLALNATIEAARAGEAGRGFAVVAQEVKTLAAQTTKATDEISSQIAAMQAATQESVIAIKEIGVTISRLSEIASTIAASVEQQGAATREITINVQQAAIGTSRVAGSIADVHRGAGETESASAQVLTAAQMLSSENKRLKSEVEKFLATVRAA
ncbi:MAG: HAMP domain-containing protein [Xanthobacteraceae bacterium]|nr:HAMP domain-containing protein [Xanthobacteraceae bacterium]